MMCRHLIFYPNLDRNGEKKDVSPDSIVILSYEAKSSAFLTGIPKEFHWHIRTLFFRLEFLNDFDAILSTQLTKQVNPVWNCLKIPKEF